MRTPARTTATGQWIRRTRSIEGTNALAIVRPPDEITVYQDATAPSGTWRPATATVGGKIYDGWMLADYLQNKQPDRAQVGLHGPADPTLSAWTPSAWEAIRLARPEAVLLLANADIDGTVVARLRMAGVKFIMARVMNTIDSSKRKTGIEYVAEVYGPTLRLYDAGVRYFQLFNEVNLYSGAAHGSLEGFGVSWWSGEDFAREYLSALEWLRHRLPHALFGFPAMSPGAAEPQSRYDPDRMLREAYAAVLSSDFMTIHEYWQHESEIERVVQRCVSEAKTFAPLPVMLTEFANTSPIPKREKAQQYRTLFARLKQVAPSNFIGSFAYCLSSSVGFASDTWIETDGTLSEIPQIIGAR